MSETPDIPDEHLDLPADAPEQDGHADLTEEQPIPDDTQEA